MNPLRAVLSALTHGSRCTELREHEPHDRCQGIADMPCDTEQWHGRHWSAPGLLCRGKGLGAICAHGEQMLNACDDC